MQPYKYKPKLNAGNLRHRVEVWGRIEYQNELLETDYQDGKIKTVWAEVVPQTGSMQRAQADTILTTCTHKIKVRYNTGKDIKEDMWFMYRGQRFDIKYILNPNFADEDLEIFVEDVTT